MTLKTVQTDNAPAAIGPYSQGISIESWLFVSGQLGIQPDTGELVELSFSAQARQALENLKQVVLAGGSSLNNVVAVDVCNSDAREGVAGAFPGDARHGYVRDDREPLDRTQ